MTHQRYAPLIGLADFLHSSYWLQSESGRSKEKFMDSIISWWNLEKIRKNGGIFLTSKSNENLYIGVIDHCESIGDNKNDLRKSRNLENDENHKKMHFLGKKFVKIVKNNTELGLVRLRIYFSQKIHRFF